MLSDFCVEELKNTITGGCDTEIARKEQEKKKRAEHFKEIQSFWENFSSGKHSVCKTTQMQQKEEIGSKQWRNITFCRKTHTDRKTSNIDKIFKDDESVCSRLDISQYINASEIPKTKKTVSLLQNVSTIRRQPEERPEITSNMNMLHRGNQFESTLGKLHLYETLCLR